MSEKCPKCGWDLVPVLGHDGIREGSACSRPHCDYERAIGPSRAELRRQLAQRNEYADRMNGPMEELAALFPGEEKAADDEIARWAIGEIGQLEAERAAMTARIENLEDSNKVVLGGALDRIWGLVYPGKTDWEYAGQVVNHIGQLLGEKDTELARLKGGLTATADGITPVNGDTLWRIDQNGDVWPLPQLEWIPSVTVAGSYSTRAAADQARQEAEKGEGDE